MSNLLTEARRIQAEKDAVEAEASAAADARRREVQEEELAEARTALTKNLRKAFGGYAEDVVVVTATKLPREHHMKDYRENVHDCVLRLKDRNDGPTVIARVSVSHDHGLDYVMRVAEGDTPREPYSSVHFYAETVTRALLGKPRTDRRSITALEAAEVLSA